MFSNHSIFNSSDLTATSVTSNKILIDSYDINALLVRKINNSGNIFKIDTINDIITINGTIEGLYNIDVNNIVVSGSILPSADNTVNIGSSSLRFDNVYSYNLFLYGPTSNSLLYSNGSNQISSAFIADPITFNTGSIGLNYNTTNLRILSHQLDTTQDISVSSSPTFANLIDSGLSINSLLYSNSSKQLTSASVSSNLTFSTGLLDTIQPIQITSSPTFNGLTLSNQTNNSLLYANGSNQISSASIADPITFSLGSLGIGYNTTNLRIVSHQLDTTQDISVSSTPTFANLIDTGLSINSLLYSNSSKQLTSGSVTANLTFSGGTLDTVQPIQTTSSPTFNGLTLSNQTANSILYSNGSEIVSSVSISNPILFSAGSLSLQYNTTNLKLTSNALNTVQDIASTSSPTFNALTITNNISCSTLNTSGNVTISGNLTVSGSTTTVNSNVVSIEDSLLQLANQNNSTDVIDIGFFGESYYNSNVRYTGLFRKASTGSYQLFKNLTVQPTTTVNTSDPSYQLADLSIGNLVCNNISSSGSLTIGILNSILSTNGSGVIQALTIGNGISYGSNTLSASINSTNLQFTAGQINTSQNINTTASPTVANLYDTGLTNTLIYANSSHLLLSPTIGPSLSWSSPTIDVIQDVRVTASPTFNALTLTLGPELIGYNPQSQCLLSINYNPTHDSNASTNKFASFITLDGLLKYTTTELGSDSPNSPTPPNVLMQQGIIYSNAYQYVDANVTNVCAFAHNTQLNTANTFQITNYYSFYGLLDVPASSIGPMVTNYFGLYIDGTQNLDSVPGISNWYGFYISNPISYVTNTYCYCGPYLGLNTATPAYQLDCNGSARISSLTANTLLSCNGSKVIESASTGNGITWSGNTLSTNIDGTNLIYSAGVITTSQPLQTSSSPSFSNIYDTALTNTLIYANSSHLLSAPTIGSSLSWSSPTLNTIQDIRTSAIPTFGGIIINQASTSVNLGSSTGDAGIATSSFGSYITLGNSTLNSNNFICWNAVLSSSSITGNYIRFKPIYSTGSNGGMVLDHNDGGNADLGFWGITYPNNYNEQSFPSAFTRVFYISHNGHIQTSNNILDDSTGLSTFVNIIDSGLTANTLVSCTSSKQLESASTGNGITWSSNTLSTNIDGTNLVYSAGVITTSQPLQTSSSPSFSNLYDTALTNTLIYANSSHLLSSPTIGPSLSWSSPTLNTIQDIRTTASPQFTGLGIGTSGPASGINVTNGEIQLGNYLFLYPYSTNNIQQGFDCYLSSGIALSNSASSSFRFAKQATIFTLDYGIANVGSTVSFTSGITLDATHGYVGISNTSPSYTLDVTGNARITTSIGINTTPSGTAGSIRTNNNILDDASGNTTIAGTISGGNAVATSTIPFYFINPNATTDTFLGIETKNAVGGPNIAGIQFRTALYGTDTHYCTDQIYIARTANGTGDMRFATSNANTTTEKMRITGAGHVLIGTTTDNGLLCTTNNILDNGSGSVTITGILDISAGSVSAPALYMSTDTSTGLYRPGANILGLSISGSNSFYLDSLSNLILGYQAGNHLSSNKFNICIGYQAGYNNTAVSTGTDCIFIGYGSGLGSSAVDYGVHLIGIGDRSIGGNSVPTNPTGGYGIGIGYGALSKLTGGTYNVAIGDFAMQLYTGNVNDFNVCIGDQSLFNATSVVNSVCIGSNTGFYSSSISQCVFVGCNAGYGVSGYSLGPSNIAIGHESMYCTTLSGMITPGGYNLAIGTGSLQVNTTGSANCGLGYASMNRNTIGNNNSALGYEALYNNTTGSSNVVVGFSALFSNTIGNYNTAVGASALYYNVSNNLNTAIGIQAGYNNLANQCVFVGTNSAFYKKAGDNCIFIGYEAGEGTNPAFDFGDNNIGIGTGSMVTGPTGAQNVAIGSNSLYALSSGGNNIAVGFNAANTVLTTGSNNIYIGAVTVPSSSNVNNEIVIGSSLTGLGSNTCYIAGSSKTSVSGPLTINTTTIDNSATCTINGSTDGVDLSFPTYGSMWMNTGNTHGRLVWHYDGTAQDYLYLTSNWNPISNHVDANMGTCAMFLNPVNSGEGRIQWLIGAANTVPTSLMQLDYGLTIGGSYAGAYNAPANGLLLQGQLVIGTSTVPAASANYVYITNPSGCSNPVQIYPNCTTWDGAHEEIGFTVSTNFAPSTADTSGAFYNIVAEPAVAMSSNHNYWWGYFYAPTIETTASNYVLSNYYGMRLYPGTLTGGGSVTNAYNLYVSAPNYGSTICQAIFADNLSIGYASQNLSGTNNVVIAGKVGIGSSTPGSLPSIKNINLYVSGGNINVDANYQINLRSDQATEASGGQWIGYPSGGLYTLLSVPNDSSTIRGIQFITSSNNAITGTISPGATIWPYTGNMAIGTTYSATRASTNNVLSVEGRIGIQTTNPTEPLEIGGTSSIVYLNSATSNTILFNSNGFAAPATTTRSVGTKVVLYPDISSTTVDYAFGIDSGVLWYSVPDSTSSYYHKFYANTTVLMTIRGDGKITTKNNTLDDNAGNATFTGNLLALTNGANKTGTTGRFVGSSNGNPAGSYNSGDYCVDQTSNVFRIYNGSVWNVPDSAYKTHIDEYVGGSAVVGTSGSNTTFSWSPPTNNGILYVEVWCIAAGAGGGAGIISSSNFASGGAGGSAGGIAYIRIPAEDLTTPVSGQAGGAGCGAQGKIANNPSYWDAAGANGSNGGNSNFGSYITATAGIGGQGGQSNANSTAYSSGGTSILWAETSTTSISQPSAGNQNAASNATNSTYFNPGSGGGGGGAYDLSGGAGYNGGNGGSVNSSGVGTSTAGGTGGIASSHTAPTAGTDNSSASFTLTWKCGSGGAGGYGQTDVSHAPTSGSDGGKYGAGAGGGGCAWANYAWNAGSGGNGACGYVRIRTVYY